MSNRFHSKYHRHNHHTDRINDPRYPDASHDPIASPDYPFMGDFVMTGSLSATQSNLSAFAGSFVNLNGPGLNVESTTMAIQAVGDVNIFGSLSANQITFPTTASLFNTGGIDSISLSATGEFLLLEIAGLPRAIRLWDYTVNGI